MIEEPLLRDNILSNIYHNFAFYGDFLSNEELLIPFTAAIAFLWLNWLITKFFFCGDYNSFASKEHFVFLKKQKSHWLGLSLAVFSFLIYCGNALYQEVSIFNNFDMMSWYYTDSLSQGIIPAVDRHLRFTPLHAVDFDVIFGISNNAYVICFYVFMKQLLIMWLLYKFFDFITVPKRLIMIAVINFFPSVLWINTAIYPEQNVVIFVILSLIFLRRFQKNNRPRQLLYFMIFMNLALYSKETAAIFYGGFGVYLLLSAVLSMKITLNSFFHPLKTIRMFPLEYLMFWSLLVFATGWMFYTDFGLRGNRYLVTHGVSITDAVMAYQTELFVNTVAIVIFFATLLMKKNKVLYLISDGSLIGCTLISCLMVFFLKIVPITDAAVPYYLYLPAIFCTAYIFENITSKILLGVFLSVVIIISGYCNVNIAEAQQGKERRDIAEYLASQARFVETVIYIDVNSPFVDHRWWKVMAWVNALLYSHPDIKIRYKLDAEVHRVWFLAHPLPVLVSKIIPSRGDYILVNKAHNPDYEPAANARLAYENRVYALYILE